MTDRLKTVYPPKTSFCGGYKKLLYIAWACFGNEDTSNSRSFFKANILKRKVVKADF